MFQIQKYNKKEKNEEEKKKKKKNNDRIFLKISKENKFKQES